MQTEKEELRQIIREELESFLKQKEQPPRFVTVAEASKILGLGLTSVYELCRQSDYNGFPCVRNGEKGKLLIPYHGLINWTDSQSKNIRAI
jgi:hypothetical protein